MEAWTKDLTLALTNLNESSSSGLIGPSSNNKSSLALLSSTTNKQSQTVLPPGRRRTKSTGNLIGYCFILFHSMCLICSNHFVTIQQITLLTKLTVKVRWMIAQLNQVYKW